MFNPDPTGELIITSPTVLDPLATVIAVDIEPSR